MAEFIPDVQVAANTATPSNSTASIAVDSVTKRLRTKDDAGQIRDYVSTDATETLSNKTLTAPVINGLTAGGSTPIDFSGDSGAFKFPTGGIANATVLAPGTTALTPLNFPNSSVLRTTPAAGDLESDAVNLYFTPETTASRFDIPIEQYNRLAANGGAITTIGNWFGATSNITLLANGFYEIDIWLVGVKSSTGDAVTFTLTNSAAPTLQHIYFDMCPITGVTGTPAASRLFATILNNSAAAPTIVTGTLTASATFDFHFKIYLKNGAGTSLKIQATNATGITPQQGSRWLCRRMPATNIGVFAA